MRDYLGTHVCLPKSLRVRTSILHVDVSQIQCLAYSAEESQLEGDMKDCMLRLGGIAAIPARQNCLRWINGLTHHKVVSSFSGAHAESPRFN